MTNSTLEASIAVHPAGKTKVSLVKNYTSDVDAAMERNRELRRMGQVELTGANLKHTYGWPESEIRAAIGVGPVEGTSEFIGPLTVLRDHLPTR